MLWIPQEILPRATRLSRRKAVSFHQNRNLVCAVTDTRRLKIVPQKEAVRGPSTNGQDRRRVRQGRERARLGSGAQRGAARPAAHTLESTLCLHIRSFYRNLAEN